MSTALWVCSGPSSFPVLSILVLSQYFDKSLLAWLYSIIGNQVFDTTTLLTVQNSFGYLRFSLKNVIVILVRIALDYKGLRVVYISIHNILLIH